MCILQRWVRFTANPSNLDPSVEIMAAQWLPPKPVRRVETQHSASFFSAVGFRAAIGGILSVFWWKVTPMHFVCFFLATQSMASKPPAVTLGLCKRCLPTLNIWKQMRHRRLNMLETWHHKLWPQPVWMSRRLTSLSQAWPMMPISSYDTFDAAQLATLFSTCNILSSVRIKWIYVTKCKTMRLATFSRFLKLFTASFYKKFLKLKDSKETSTETMTAGAVMRGGGSKRSRVWPGLNVMLTLCPWTRMDQKNGRLNKNRLFPSWVGSR